MGTLFRIYNPGRLSSHLSDALCLLVLVGIIDCIPKNPFSLGSWAPFRNKRLTKVISFAINTLWNQRNLGKALKGTESLLIKCVWLHLGFAFDYLLRVTLQIGLFIIRISFLWFTWFWYLKLKRLPAARNLMVSRLARLSFWLVAQCLDFFTLPTKVYSAKTTTTLWKWVINMKQLQL